MIYWQGRNYPLVPREYNGKVCGWLLDGILQATLPRGVIIRGHIVTEHGVIVVVRRDFRWGIALLVLTISALVIALWPRYEYLYYQVAFAESPVYRDGTLYCNVVNVADMDVTVQFIGSASKTGMYQLSPGETLPYIYIDFVPEVIRYNGDFDFPLEVRSD